MLKRRRLILAVTLSGFLGSGLCFFFALPGLGNAVRNEVDYIQPRHTLLMQVINGVRVFLAEDRDQYIGAGDFLLAVARALHVHDRALNHALETEGRLRVGLRVRRQNRGVVGDEVLQIFSQVIDIACAST